MINRTFARHTLSMRGISRLTPSAHYASEATASHLAGISSIESDGNHVSSVYGISSGRNYV